MVFLMQSLIALNVGDTLASAFLIGLRYTTEANPIMAAIATNIGLLVFVKAAISLVAGGLTWKLRNAPAVRKPVLWLAATAVVAYLCVFVLELAAIAMVFWWSP